MRITLVSTVGSDLAKQLANQSHPPVVQISSFEPFKPFKTNNCIWYDDTTLWT